MAVASNDTLPAGMRNNNPGNIKFTPSINWQGQIGPSANLDQGDPQVVFDSPVSGMRALAKNVLYKFNNDGASTINQLIAGPDGWTPGYTPGANGVAMAAGIPGDQPVNMNDPNVLSRVLRGIVTQEQGPSSQQYSDQLIAAGIQAANGHPSAIPQYDSAGNPIQPAQPATAQAQPTTAASEPAAPAQASADDDALLAKYLGGTTASSTGTAPAQSAASSADDALLAKYLGPTTPAANPFGTASQPGTPQYAKDALTFIQNGGTPPTPASGPPPESSAGAPSDVVPGWARAFSESAVNAVPVLGPGMHNLRNALLGPQGAAQADQIGQTAQSQNPLAATAGSVFGTVAPFVIAGGTELGAQALGTAADYGAGPVGNALLRTAAGGVSGAGISGADTLARGGTAQQATNNALLGGAIGAAAPTVLGLAGKALGGAKNAFFGPSAPKMLANAVKADQNDPTAINALLQQNGAGSTVADTGPNAQGLAAGLASLPGQAKTTVVGNLQARAAQTGTRLAQDVAGTIGQGQPIGALTDSIINAQKSAADPLYAAVRGQPIQMTPELQEFLSTPLGKSALAQGQQLAANDGVKLGVQEQPTAADVANQVLAGKLTPQQGEQQMASIASGSQPAVPNLNVGILDYAKRALDDQASAAVRAGTNNAARQASGKASQLTGIIDAQVPAYAQARAAFAGPAKVLDAVDMGQQLFSSQTSPEDLQSALAGMSPSEKDGLLAGAQAAVQKTIGNARTDAAGVKSLFDSANGKEKLSILVGPDQAQQISDALARERNFSTTSGKAYQNSITSANLAQQKIINPQLAGLPQQAPPQTSIGLLISGLEKARGAITGAYRNAQNNRLANMLTSGALSNGDAAAVAGAATPRNALLAPAAVSSAAQQNNAQLPGLGAFQQPKLVFRDGKWIPQIVVGPANALTQGMAQ